MTPVKHIPRMWSRLSSFGQIRYIPEATPEQTLNEIRSYEAIFTNPNKSNVYLGREIIEAGKKLRVICTASTGTNHIDEDYAAKKKVTVLSLKEERHVIDSICSTAEHAFALMMAALRKIPQGWESVKQGKWDYEPFIGRQVDHLTIGVVGFG